MQKGNSKQPWMILTITITTMPSARTMTVTYILTALDLAIHCLCSYRRFGLLARPHVDAQSCSVCNNDSYQTRRHVTAHVTAHESSRTIQTTSHLVRFGQWRWSTRPGSGGCLKATVAQPQHWYWNESLAAWCGHDVQRVVSTTHRRQRCPVDSILVSSLVANRLAHAMVVTLYAYLPMMVDVGIRFHWELSTGAVVVSNQYPIQG